MKAEVVKTFIATKDIKKNKKGEDYTLVTFVDTDHNDMVSAVVDSKIPFNEVLTRVDVNLKLDVRFGDYKSCRIVAIEPVM